MRKLFNVFLAVLFLFGIALPVSSIAASNLVLNSSFESLNSADDWANWTESGNISQNHEFVRTGSTSVLIYNDLEPVYNTTSGAIKSDWFNFTELGTYEFGAYFKIFSATDPATLVWPSDRPGITTEVKTASGTVWPNQIVNIDSLLAATWVWDPVKNSYITTEWLLLGGTFDVTEVGMGYVNIYLQEYDLDNFTAIAVDDVFVRQQAPVPEPSTMLLFGFGLGALGIYSRKRSKK